MRRSGLGGEYLRDALVRRAQLLEPQGGVSRVRTFYSMAFVHAGPYRRAAGLRRAPRAVRPTLFHSPSGQQLPLGYFSKEEVPDFIFFRFFLYQNWYLTQKISDIQQQLKQLPPWKKLIISHNGEKYQMVFQ